MDGIIDRRDVYNKKKNLKNRRRYLDRVKKQVKEAVNKSISKGKLDDLAKGKKIKVKVKDTSEPSFSQDSETGSNDIVAPGNRRYNPGDSIPRPPQEGGGGGSKAGDGDDGEDDFTFTLTKEEYYNILFEDLELPDLVKMKLNSNNA